jgi:hypothetical protein
MAKKQTKLGIVIWLTWLALDIGAGSLDLWYYNELNLFDLEPES